MLYSLTTHIIHVPGHGLGHEVRALLVIVAIFKILGLQVVSVNIFERATPSDSNRHPVALISNITLIPASTRSKNDTITSIYTSTFSQKYTITLIDTSMQF